MQGVDARVLLPVRSAALRQPDAAARAAAALHHDGDRDLAEPAARLPAQGVKTMLVNGRISSRSYPRYRLRAAVLPARARRRRSVLHAERRIGAAHHRHRRRPGAGDGHRQSEVRFARTPAMAAGRGAGRVLRYFRIPPGRPVFIAASTLKGEEAAGARRVRRRAPRLIRRARSSSRRASPNGSPRPKRLRAPRASASSGAPSWPSTPSRAPTSSSSTRSASWRTCSRWRRWSSSAAVWSTQGGHNILEPAVHGKPIVFGPHMENFAEIAATFLQNQAAVQVAGRRDARRPSWPG